MTSKLTKSIMILLALTLPQALAVTTDVSGYPLAAIIISPLVMGLLFLVGAFALDPEEHGILRIFFVLFALMTYFLTAWMGMQTVVAYYDFTAMQESIALSVWVMGGVMVVTISYFIIWIFYRSTQAAKQEQQEMMLQ